MNANLIRVYLRKSAACIILSLAGDIDEISHTPKTGPRLIPAQYICAAEIGSLRSL
jgi:hypothetical protein